MSKITAAIEAYHRHLADALASAMTQHQGSLESACRTTCPTHDGRARDSVMFISGILFMAWIWKLSTYDKESDKDIVGDQANRLILATIGMLLMIFGSLYYSLYM